MGLANAERELAIVSAALKAPANLVAIDAVFAIVSIVLSILGIRFVTPPFGVDGSFPPISYGHPQVQTVPSSQKDAPCPVVTPSLWGLARRFLPYYPFYPIFLQQSTKNPLK